VEQSEELDLAVKILEVSPAVYLSTISGDGFPETRAMLNLRNKSIYPNLAEVFNEHKTGLLVYFTTNTSSHKVEQLKANPKVCVYYSKPEEWRGLMLQGNLEIVHDLNIKKTLWQKDWMMYYPKGIDDVDYAILRFCPLLAKGYHQLKNYTINF